MPHSPQLDCLTDASRPARALPVLAEQADIRYHEAAARSVLNAPAATGMPFWSLNPYVGCAFGCAYCYARYAHRYTMERASEDATTPSGDDGALPPWLAFERRILVKRDAAALLERALRPGSRAWRAIVERGEPVAIGTATDPYQPAERRFRVTRAVLGVLARFEGLRIGIITKSALVTRDAALLGEIARRSRLTVNVSLITTDRDLARLVEPRAPTPAARLRAVRRLREAGVDVGVNCMPVLPGITDDPRALDALVAAVGDAGATHLNACALRLRSTARQRYLPWLAETFPRLAPRYRAAYAASHQPGDAYRARLRALLVRLCAEHGVTYGAFREESDEYAAARALREAAARGATADGAAGGMGEGVLVGRLFDGARHAAPGTGAAAGGAQLHLPL